MTTNDPAIAEVLAATREDVQMILAGDADGFADILAADAIVHAPLNRVSKREDSIAAFRGGFIDYGAFERHIEHAARLGEYVVTMGEEVLKPKGKSPHAGKTVRRRFTDIWRKDPDRWRIAVRQPSSRSNKKPAPEGAGNSQHACLMLIVRSGASRELSCPASWQAPFRMAWRGSLSASAAL